MSSHVRSAYSTLFVVFGFLVIGWFLGWVDERLGLELVVFGRVRVWVHKQGASKMKLLEAEITPPKPRLNGPAKTAAP
jgi:hypothetical protein